MRAELETVCCVNGCDDRKQTALYEFGDFRICRCSVCNLVYLNPRLREDQLEAFYGKEEYLLGNHKTGYDNYEKDRPLYEKTFSRRLRLIKQFKPTGKILDIGCSLGFFLNVTRNERFEPWGLDCSRYAVEQCSKRFPGKIRYGFLEHGIFPDKYFDVVSMFDLFEHVYHPHQFLSALHEVTKDDGIIIITTPNHESLLSRVSGKGWVSYKIPEHVYYYSPRTLRKMVNPLFDVALIRPEGQYCSLAFLADRIKTISRPLGSGLFQIAHRLGAQDLPVYVNSGSMTVILRKKIERLG